MKCLKDNLLPVVCDYCQVSNLLQKISCPKDLIPGKLNLAGILVWVPQSVYIWRRKKQSINHELCNLNFFIETVHDRTCLRIDSFSRVAFCSCKKKQQKYWYQRYLDGKGNVLWQDTYLHFGFLKLIHQHFFLQPLTMNCKIRFGQSLSRKRSNEREAAHFKICLPSCS